MVCRNCEQEYMEPEFYIGGSKNMDKEAWIRKLTSRKFWAAIAAFVTGLIAYFKNPGDPTALIMSFGAVVAYIVAEGFIDAAREKTDKE